MHNVGDLKAAIRARGYGSDTGPEQLILLNSVQRALLGDHRWRFMLDEQDVPMVAGTTDYTLVGAVHHVEAVSLVDASGGDLLIDRSDLDTFDADLGTSEGFLWVELQPGVIRLAPEPTQGGTLTARYVFGAPELSLDTDVPVVPEHYRDVLVAGVCRLLAMRERQPDAVAMFTSERDELMRGMRAQHGLKRYASRVVESGSHDYRAILRG